MDIHLAYCTNPVEHAQGVLQSTVYSFLGTLQSLNVHGKAINMVGNNACIQKPYSDFSTYAAHCVWMSRMITNEVKWYKNAGICSV